MYLVWREGDESEDEGTPIDAATVSQAAHGFAVVAWTSEDSDTMCLVVRDPDGALYDAEVHVNWDPSFSTGIVKPRAGDAK